MVKNAFLSIKKNIGKTVLLFVIMFVIANLIIAGLSIQSASTKSMDQIRSSLGNDVTLTTNMQNMMSQREKGQALNEVMDKVTIEMADQLKDLEYVESYNYTISTNVTSDAVSPVTMEEATTSDQNSDMTMPDGQGGQGGGGMQMDSSLTISANTTMEYLSDFTDETYTLSEGRLLSASDEGTNNCVIETTLASDNDLSVGDTINVYSSSDSSLTVDLTIVGIYTVNDNTVLGGPNSTSAFNTIYSALSVGQTLTNSTTDLSSATYYLDDPENVDAFKELAEENSTIDFESYTLDSNDMLYQQNSSSLENTQTFATMFLLVVVVAGSVILCLILMLTIRSRFYEIGVFLSLGQSKLKIISQQLIEVLMIGVIAFVLSLGTGKMVSNVISNMLESGSNDRGVRMEMPAIAGEQSDSDSSTSTTTESETTRGGFDMAMSGPTDSSNDVSITGTTVIQLAGITCAICVISVILPSVYVLRLSPRAILVKKEG